MSCCCVERHLRAGLTDALPAMRLNVEFHDRVRPVTFVTRGEIESTVRRLREKARSIVPALRRLRTNRAAVISSTREIAIWATTNALRVRERCVPPGESFLSAWSTSVFEACSAGASPKSNPVARDTRRVNSKTRTSTPRSSETATSAAACRPAEIRSPKRRRDSIAHQSETADALSISNGDDPQGGATANE